MKRPRKPTGRPAPRNPHARVLGNGLFRAKVVKDPKAYVRRPKHPKPVKPDEAES
jgi:hypothetical protein